MAKSKFTCEQQPEIAHIQEQDGITRKSAIRKFQKAAKPVAAPIKKAPAKAAKTRKHASSVWLDVRHANRRGRKIAR